MIPEESETPTGGPSRPSDRDLLAERRARRAAESGDPALVRRAEAAEATVKTLETHLASLQQRLLDTEESGRRSAERLAERELQLRRIKQQEYAEQQLRIEAEQALQDANRRLAGSDGQAKLLAGLQERVAELERRSLQLAREIDAERLARERTERALEAMRESHVAMAATVRELRAVAASLRAAADRRSVPEQASVLPSGSGGPRASAPVRAGAEISPSTYELARPPAPTPTLTPAPPPETSSASRARSEEMAEALAVAVERLRMRAEAEATDVEARGVEPGGVEPGRVATGDIQATHTPGRAPEPPPKAPPEQDRGAPGRVPSPTLAPPAIETGSPAPADATPAQPRPVGRTKGQPHKHSKSLIGRLKAARKQRHERG